MKLQAAIFLLLCVALFSCNPNNNTQPQFGTLDTQAIAADTTMQLAMESSYEFHKTLNLNSNEVIDAVAWGAPKQGEYALMFRDTLGSDTIAKTMRNGRVKDCWLTDLNANGKPEVIAIIQTTDSNSYEEILGYEIEGKKAAVNLPFNIKLLKQYVSEYRGNDTMYYSPQTETVYHEFPLVNADTVAGRMFIQYKLRGLKFEAVDFKVKKY